MSAPTQTASSAGGLRHLFWANADILLFLAVLALKVTYFNFITDVGIAWHGVFLTAFMLLIAIFLACFLPRGGRLPALVCFDVLFSAVLLADMIYYRFFEDVIAAPIVLQIWQGTEVADSIVELLAWSDLIFIADVPLWVGLVWLRRTRVTFRRRRAWAWPAYAGAIGACVWGFCGRLESARADSEEFFKHVYACKYLAHSLGVLPFHIYDIAVSIDEKLNGITVTDAEVDEIHRWFQARDAAESEAPIDPRVPFGMARSKNFIIIQVESLQPDVVGMEYNGHKVTPHLDALIRDSIVFDRCFDQTHMGRSSDADFCGYNSLHPVARGSMVWRYPDANLHAFPHLLRQQGYHAFMTCGMDGGFWNMNWMHRRYGFGHRSYERDYVPQEMAWFGLSDKAFFRQTLPRVEKLPQPFLAHFITLTNHHPYWFVPEHEWKLPLGSLDGTQAGALLQSVHYTDAAIGLFVQGLKERGLYDDSVILIYGDHDGVLPKEYCRWLDGPANRPWGFKGLDRVAMILKLPGNQVVERRSTTTGHLDFAPTLLHLAGISREGTFFLGHNLFRANGNAVVPFRDGTFADQEHLFTSHDGTWANARVYSLDTAAEVNKDACAESFREARKRLQMSDLIIQGDLIPRLKAKRE